MKTVEPRGFSGRFSYKFILFNRHGVFRFSTDSCVSFAYLCLSRNRICPFHLSFLVCWHKVVIFLLTFVVMPPFYFWSQYFVFSLSFLSKITKRWMRKPPTLLVSLFLLLFWLALPHILGLLLAVCPFSTVRSLWWWQAFTVMKCPSLSLVISLA